MGLSPAERAALAWRANHGIVPAFALDALTPEERERVKNIGSAKARRILITQTGDVPLSNVTHIVILAQGEQKRLPNLLGYPKQGLRLPWCDHTPLMVRTLRQLQIMCPDACITVICGAILRGVVESYQLPDFDTGTVQQPGLFARRATFVELAQPGNSALKGIARFLERIAYGSDPDRDPDRVVVLLGDVVYSWGCLQELITQRPHAPAYPYAFVGTTDLTPSTGELWGITWTRSGAPEMIEGLGRALDHHPPFDDYQPGQLRRWLWEMRGKDVAGVFGAYHGVDDYTRDIDLPEHIEMIPALSRSAMEDDKQYGLRWASSRAQPQ